jgi:hypothetical protein
LEREARTEQRADAVQAGLPGSVCREGVRVRGDEGVRAKAEGVRR